MNGLIFLIMFITLIVGNVFIWMFLSWRLIYRENPGRFKTQIDQIQLNGVRCFYQDCGGRIGKILFSEGTLTIAVYEQGILFSPMLCKDGYILKEEILEIKE